MGGVVGWRGPSQTAASCLSGAYSPARPERYTLPQAQTSQEEKKRRSVSWKKLFGCVKKVLNTVGFGQNN